MSKERKYQFIKPLKEKPTLKPKVSKESLSQKIVEEFLESKEKYAEVELPEGKEVRGIMIGLGRFIKKQGKDKELEVRKDSKGRVILLRKP